MNNNPNWYTSRKEQEVIATTKTTTVAVLIALGLALTASVGAAETELVGPQTPWRVFLRLGPYVARKDGALVGIVAHNRESRPGDFAKAEFLKDWTARHTPAPAEGWFHADFDDSTWGRYQTNELGERAGGYGGGDEFAPAQPYLLDRLYLRTCFGISDPAVAQDLTLELACLAGAVVYLNGKEVGRGHLPAGDLDAAAYADDYPAEAYLAEDGTTFLPGMQRLLGGIFNSGAAGWTLPEPKWKDRYEQRVRRLKMRLPPESLVKGANVLAVEIRRAPFSRLGPHGSFWQHAGFHSASLLSASGKGAVAWTAAVGQTYVWNAWPMETVTEKHTQEKPERTHSKRSFFTRGLETGNPCEPLRPVRIAVPRNGNCAGVAVISDQRGVKGLSAKVSPLAGPGGATLNPEAIEIRYAAHQRSAYERPWCDVLLPAPPAEAKNVPVWLLVSPPKDQAPGWYTGTMSLSANDQAFQVPVEVLVTAFAVPAPRENRSMVGMIHSPDTVALQYGVEPWSEKHFTLMEKTIALMGQLGSDVAHVPVVLGSFRGVKTGMIRWVKQGDGYRRDYSAMEKYLDLWTKHCGPPKALTIHMYAPENDPEAFESRDGGGKGILAGRNAKATLPKVTLLDPASGGMTELAAPWIGDPAGESFWRPVFEEVRAIVRRRGWPDNVIMIGEPTDQRPSLRFVKLMEQWAPYARWSLFSHFSGDGSGLVGAAKRTGEDNVQADGRWLALPGLEVGYGAMPHEPLSPAMTQDEGQRKRAGLIGGTSRTCIRGASSAEAYRTHVWWTGNSVQYGMDYWILSGGNCLHNGAGLGMLFSNIPVSMTVPGPDGPLPTVRFQMYREAVQETEAWLTIVGTCATRQDEQAKSYMALYRDAVNLYARGGGVENSVLPLAKLSLGWPGAIARAYEAAGELTGAKSEANWQQPPATK